jgi:hypothetical protein
MDEMPVFDNKKDRFKYWFVNVYWFHYKTHTIVLSLLLLAAVSLFHSIVFKPEPAVTVVIAAEIEFEQEYGLFLAEELRVLVRELTGNRSAIVDFLILNVDLASMHGMANAILLSSRLSDERTLLYVFDSATIYNLFGDDEAFRSLEPYGYGDIRYIDVSDAPRIVKLRGEHDIELYAGFVMREEAMDDGIVTLSIAALEHLMEP